MLTINGHNWRSGGPTGFGAACRGFDPCNICVVYSLSGSGCLCKHTHDIREMSCLWNYIVLINIPSSVYLKSHVLR